MNPGPVFKKTRFLKIWFRKIRKAYYSFIAFSGNAVLRPFFTKKKQDSETVRRILIVRVDRLGDLILSIPAIRAVRETFKEAEITLLVSPENHEIARGIPGINATMVFEKGLLSMTHSLKKSKFDLVLVLHPGFRLNFLSWLTGAKQRAGYATCGAGFFLTHGLPDDRDVRSRHEVESALEIAGLAGAVTENREVELNISPGDMKLAEDYISKNIKQNRFAVVHPGSRYRHIRWLPEGFAQVADYLVESGMDVIVLAGPGENALAGKVAEMMKHKPVILSGISLGKLSGLLSRASLFVGNSTGTMHLAAALKIPVVAIFGNNHPLDSYRSWGPWGKGNIVVKSDLSCRGCHPADCKSFDCMKAVKPADVIAAIRTMPGFRRK